MQYENVFKPTGGPQQLCSMVSCNRLPIVFYGGPTTTQRPIANDCDLVPDDFMPGSIQVSTLISVGTSSVYITILFSHFTICFIIAAGCSSLNIYV